MHSQMCTYTNLPLKKIGYSLYFSTKTSALSAKLDKTRTPNKSGKMKNLFQSHKYEATITVFSHQWVRKEASEKIAKNWITK